MSNKAQEARQASLLYGLTDALLYLIGLNAAVFARWDTLYQVHFALLQRDRLIATALFAACALLAGSYKPGRVSDRFDAVYYLSIALACALGLQLALTSLVPFDLREISRRELVLGAGAAGLLLVPWRFWAANLMDRFPAFHRYFYVVGSEAEGKRIAREIESSAAYRAGARYCTLDNFKQRAGREAKKSGSGQPMDNAIVTLSEADRGQLHDLLEVCGTHCRQVFLHPSLYDTLLISHAHLVEVAGIPLLEVGNPGLSAYMYVKRLIDIAASAAGLALALPIFVLPTALAIKLTSRGPVLYSQERMGRDGRVFRLYKFRSMVSEAESGTGPVWAKADDDRVTPVGRFIRKHRIDEIPQLFNVLRGDMSLVGPRPERPHFHEEFKARWPLFDKRLAVRPGVTSLSHVLGTYASEPGDRLRYDLIYISSLSVLTDLRVLVDTVRVVLGAKGAR